MILLTGLILKGQWFPVPFRIRSKEFDHGHSLQAHLLKPLCPSSLTLDIVNILTCFSSLNAPLPITLESFYMLFSSPIMPFPSFFSHCWFWKILPEPSQACFLNHHHLTPQNPGTLTDPHAFYLPMLSVSQCKLSPFMKAQGKC